MLLTQYKHVVTPLGQAILREARRRKIAELHDLSRHLKIDDGRMSKVILGTARIAGAHLQDGLRSFLGIHAEAVLNPPLGPATEALVRRVPESKSQSQEHHLRVKTGGRALEPKKKTPALAPAPVFRGSQARRQSVKDPAKQRQGRATVSGSKVLVPAMTKSRALRTTETSEPLIASVVRSPARSPARSTSKPNPSVQKRLHEIAASIENLSGGLKALAATLRDLSQQVAAQ